MSATDSKRAIFPMVSMFNDPYEDVVFAIDEGLTVEVYLVPGKTSKGLRKRYEDLGVIAGVCNYHGSTYETATWEYEEALSKLEELEDLGYPRVMMTIMGSQGLKRAIEDRGWGIANLNAS